MKKDLETYIKENLIEPISYMDFISKPEYKLAYEMMKFEYKFLGENIVKNKKL